MQSTIKKSVLGALAGVSLILATGVAGATESTFCPDEFTSLTAEIQAGDFTNERDQDGLLGKTESAVLKSNLLKVTDALKNLADIQAKVLTLSTAAKPKLGAEAANAIFNAAGAAATCVGAIAVQ